MIEFKTNSDIPKYFTGIFKVTETKNIYHMKDGKFHNENGPAIICANKSKFWYINGICHREDGHAEEYANGSKSWIYKGECYGLNNDFTIKTWIEFVEQLRREEQLKIFL